MTICSLSSTGPEILVRFITNRKHDAHGQTRDLLKDGCRQLAPQRAHVAIRVGGQGAVMVQELGSGTVVATFELKFGVMKQCVDLIWPNIEIL